MPDFPSGHVYTSGPLDALYVRYCLRCRVDREDAKAYYWPQLERIYDRVLIDIADWEDCRLFSDQALERRIGKNAMRKTLRKAPTGGLQELTRDRLHKVATRYLSDNAHLCALFDGDRDRYEQYFAPKGSEHVHFLLTEIRAHRQKLAYDRSLTFASLPHDLMLRIGGYDWQYATSASDPINQVLDISVWEGAMPAPKREALVHDIAALTGAVHVWRAESGFIGDSYTDAEGLNRVRYWVEDRYEDAIDGRNRYGSQWIDMLRTEQGKDA
jgi:hypothetical protein